jgi:hypothetical protein
LESLCIQISKVEIGSAGSSSIWTLLLWPNRYYGKLYQIRRPSYIDINIHSSYFLTVHTYIYIHCIQIWHIQHLTSETPQSWETLIFEVCRIRTWNQRQIIYEQEKKRLYSFKPIRCDILWYIIYYPGCPQQTTNKYLMDWR